MNGMTQATSDPSDVEAGVVFDWDGKDATYELQLPKGSYDLRAYGLPLVPCGAGNATPEHGRARRTVVVHGRARRRTGRRVGGRRLVVRRAHGDLPATRYGAGEGWANEFNTIRIPVTAFDADGRAIDLGDIRTIRFAFGPSYGSELGRIGLDDVEVTFR
jgi:hypothetical protein